MRSRNTKFELSFDEVAELTGKSRSKCVRDVLVQRELEKSGLGVS